MSPLGALVSGCDVPIERTALVRQLSEWLDDGNDAGGARLQEMHRRLVSYFVRRNRPGAEELAAKTLHRIASDLQNDPGIRCMPPAHYCYRVARTVLIEDLERARRKATPARERIRRALIAWLPPCCTGLAQPRQIDVNG
jgi:DNA-directed RNA polymerase specialized sigma24 family protein